MTELPINCCPGSTTPVSPHCIAEDYLIENVWREYRNLQDQYRKLTGRDYEWLR